MILTLTHQLWKIKQPMLGLLGGVLGLLVSLSFGKIDFSSLSCGCEFFGATVVPSILGSILGIGGGAFSLIRKREGGLILFAGTMVAVSPWLVILGNSHLSWIPFAFYIIYFAWWNALILFGGLLAFTRTRRILKRLHEGGWIP